MKILFLFLFLTSIVFASKSSKSLSAHTHGLVGVDMAVEGSELLVLLTSPSVNIIGFEHKPKNQKQIKKIADAKKNWIENFSDLISFDGIKKCKEKKISWKQEFSGGSHSEIKAEMHIDCPFKLAGKKVEIKLKEKYSKIDQIHFQLIREDGTAINEKKTINIFDTKL